MFTIKRLIPVLLLVVGVLLVGLGVAGAQDGQLVFAMVSHGGSGNPFWIVAMKGMEDACALLEAECQWLSEPVDGIPQMEGWWEEALALNPDGIGTTAPNVDVIRDSVARAHELGIPVIIFNANDPNAGTDQSIGGLFYIGANGFTGQVANARAILAAAAADGVEITGAACPIQEVGHADLEARCAGARSVFEEAGVPFQNLTTSNDVPTTVGILTDFFAANPEVNAITNLGPLPSSAYHLFVQEAGIEPGQIYATTMDTGSEIFDMIDEGYLVQAVDQQQYIQGFETIMWLFLNSQYLLKPGGDILTGPGIVDASNVGGIRDLVTAGYR
jgi:simple sugar transport system substrate-binding protein